MNKKLSFSLLFKWLFRLSTLVLIGYNLTTATDPNLKMSYITNGSLVLLCSFLPDIILKILKYHMSTSIDLLIQIFIFLSMLLGRMYHFYSLVPWWDLFLHMISGVVLGFLSLSILKGLTSKDIFKKLSPQFVFVFILLFIITSAALWEFWEFAGDQLFGLDSQFNSLTDTMTDMIIGTIGGMIVAIMGYFHIKNESFKFLDGFINAFIKI